MARKWWRIVSGSSYCEICKPYVEGSPYPDGDIPSPPFHEFCDCKVVPLEGENQMNDSILRATFDVQSNALDVEAGIYQATVMTDREMRSGDSIEVAGGLLDDYMRNPIVPWMHQYDQPPVAKCLALEKLDHAISARFQFAPKGASRRIDEIHALWRDGFLNAVSIGIQPLEWVELKGNGDSWFPPRRFTKWDMVEFSIVSIPNNPDALRMGWQGGQREEVYLPFFRSVSSSLSMLKELYK